VGYADWCLSQPSSRSDTWYHISTTTTSKSIIAKNLTIRSSIIYANEETPLQIPRHKM
jgi:hypothetical protein